MGFEKLSFSRFLLVSSRSPIHPSFLSRGNGSVRSNCVAKRSKGAARGAGKKGEREREKIGEKRGVPYARTIEKKLVAILAPPHGQLPTRLPLSASLPPPLLSLCVSYATASRTTTAPNKIQSRLEGDYNSIDRGRTKRQGFVVYSYSKPISSGDGEGGFRFSFPGCLGWEISRNGNDRLPFRLPLIIVARLIHDLRFFDSSRGYVWKAIHEDDPILFFF